MLSQKRHIGKYDSGWAVSLEKWWRKAAGYSRLNGTSSPPLSRRLNDIQMKKLDSNSSTVQRPLKTNSRRPSTARPVVIVERTREIRPPPWSSEGRNGNINEDVIEVFYWTQSRYNYPGQLERYKKNLCYCCADCPACRVEDNRSTSFDKHRPLSQSKNINSRDDIPLTKPTLRVGSNGNYLRTSYA